MKLKSGTVIALAFAAVFGGGWAVREAITDRLVMQEKFAPLVPGRVNVVGLAPGSGYRIIVANQMAQLVQTSDTFGGEAADEESGATEGAIKRRLPVREMLRVLAGDGKALGTFAMILNEMAENDDWPTERVVWRAEDIRKALDGDASLRARLVRDLNVELDGTPLPRLRITSFENGIVLDYPVSVTVNIGGKPTLVTGRVQEPYRPGIMRVVENEIKDKADLTPQVIAGFYRLEAEAILKQPGKRENVRQILESRISEARAKELAEKPARVLEKAIVVVNDSLVENASYRGYEDADGKKAYDLSLNVNDEGRRRLWQYSKRRMGSQLLLCADGIPIAAPMIKHELPEGTLRITRMKDEVLVRSAVDDLNRK